MPKFQLLLAKFAVQFRAGSARGNGLLESTNSQAGGSSPIGEAGIGQNSTPDCNRGAIRSWFTECAASGLCRANVRISSVVK